MPKNAGDEETEIVKPLLARRRSRSSHRAQVQQLLNVRSPPGVAGQERAPTRGNRARVEKFLTEQPLIAQNLFTTAAPFWVGGVEYRLFVPRSGRSVGIAGQKTAQFPQRRFARLGEPMGGGRPAERQQRVGVRHPRSPPVHALYQPRPEVCSISNTRWKHLKQFVDVAVEHDVSFGGGAPQVEEHQESRNRSRRVPTEELISNNQRVRRRRSDLVVTPDKITAEGSLRLGAEITIQERQRRFPILRAVIRHAKGVERIHELRRTEGRAHSLQWGT